MSEYEVFNPTNNPCRGEVYLPGDKSISQRAVILAAMAEGTSHIYGCSNAEDVMSVVKAMMRLGAQVTYEPSKNNPRDNVDLTITGWGAGGPSQPEFPIDCGNSATCARVTMGVLTPYDIEVIFDGDESLHHRPFMRVVDPLMQMGAQFKVLDRAHGSGPQRSTLPLRITGTSDASAIYYEMPVASSQVKASILFAGCNCEGDTIVTEPYQSRDHSELLLKAFGAEVDIDKENLMVTLHGPAHLHACDIHVPGDISSASYFVIAAALVPGSKVVVKDVSINPTRMGFVRALQEMGAKIKTKPVDADDDRNFGGEPVGDIKVKYAGRLDAIQVTPDKIPQLVDEVPILAFAAACAEGDSVFYGVKELKLKETNRIHATADGLNRLGTKAEDKNDNLFVVGGIDIEGKTTIYPSDDVVELKNYGDHRLAIISALAGYCGFKPVKMNDVGVAKISYPHFFEDIERLTSGAQ